MTDAATELSREPAEDEWDAESRALWRNPAFRAMLERSQRSAEEHGTISLEELDRRYPMTDAERARADAYLDALDRLEEEQDAEVTDDQGRLLELVLTAAMYARGQGTLDYLVEASGCAEADIRAVAAALQVLGLDAAPASRNAAEAPVSVHAS